jgi:hypothetical protein
MRFDFERYTEIGSPPVVPFGSNRLKIADAAIGIAIKEFFSIPASPQGFVLIGKSRFVNKALILDELAPFENFRRATESEGEAFRTV